MPGPAQLTLTSVATVSAYPVPVNSLRRQIVGLPPVDHYVLIAQTGASLTVTAPSRFLGATAVSNARLMVLSQIPEYAAKLYAIIDGGKQHRKQVLRVLEPLNSDEIKYLRDYYRANYFQRVLDQDLLQHFRSILYQGQWNERLRLCLLGLKDNHDRSLDYAVQALNMVVTRHRRHNSDAIGILQNVLKSVDAPQNPDGKKITNAYAQKYGQSKPLFDLLKEKLNPATFEENKVLFGRLLTG